MPDTDLAWLYELVAQKLSGRDVRVIFKQPITRGIKGEFTRADDIGYIRISPGLDVRNRLYTYLHEVSHALLHWDAVKSSDFHTLGSELIDYNDSNSQEYNQHEEEATAQGRAWYRWAENYCCFIHDEDYYELMALNGLYALGD